MTFAFEPDAEGFAGAESTGEPDVAVGFVQDFADFALVGVVGFGCHDDVWCGGAGGEEVDVAFAGGAAVHICEGKGEDGVGVGGGAAGGLGCGVGVDRRKKWQECNDESGR